MSSTVEGARWETVDIDASIAGVGSCPVRFTLGASFATEACFGIAGAWMRAHSFGFEVSAQRNDSFWVGAHLGLMAKGRLSTAVGFHAGLGTSVSFRRPYYEALVGEAYETFHRVGWLLPAADVGIALFFRSLVRLARSVLGGSFGCHGEFECA